MYCIVVVTTWFTQLLYAQSFERHNTSHRIEITPNREVILCLSVYINDYIYASDVLNHRLNNKQQKLMKVLQWINRKTHSSPKPIWKFNSSMITNDGKSSTGRVGGLLCYLTRKTNMQTNAKRSEHKEIWTKRRNKKKKDFKKCKISPKCQFWFSFGTLSPNQIWFQL